MISEDGLSPDAVEADIPLALWYACRGLWAAGDLRLWAVTTMALAVCLAVSMLGCVFLWNMSQGTTTLKLMREKKQKANA